MRVHHQELFTRSCDWSCLVRQGVASTLAPKPQNQRQDTRQSHKLLWTGSCTPKLLQLDTKVITSYGRYNLTINNWLSIVIFITYRHLSALIACPRMTNTYEYFSVFSSAVKSTGRRQIRWWKSWPEEWRDGQRQRRRPRPFRRLFNPRHGDGIRVMVLVVVALLATHGTNIFRPWVD